MIPILYESNETAFTSNGLGRLRDCISCVVSESRNSAFECDFEYPVTGSLYDKIQCGRIIAVEHDDSDDVQPFDIVSYSRPINGVVTFHAVHISYRQSGLTVHGTNVNSLSEAFSMLSNAEPENPFAYETDKNSTGYLATADGIPRSVRSILGGTEGSILDTYGGEYEWDKWTVYLHNARGSQKTFTIRYGVNMIDYTDESDYSETYSAVVPYWTGSDVADGQITVVGNMVSSGLTTYNGKEICVPLDLSDKFEAEPTTTELENMAAELLAYNEPVLPKQTIKVDFIRLQDTDEYTQFEDLLECKLCDSIRVVFPLYDMSGWFKIVKTEYDVLLEKYKSMELGTLSTSLAEALGVSSSTTDRLQDSTVDYITEQSTSGSWAYRKWNSGRIEAWYEGTVTASATSASGNIYRSSYSLTIPSVIGFSSAPNLICTEQRSTTVIIGHTCNATSATNIDGIAWRTNANSSTWSAYPRIYCWGD